jgi:hypothetical protein
MDEKKLPNEGKYEFVVLCVDIYNYTEIMQNYPQYITQYQTGVQKIYIEIYQRKTYAEISLDDGFIAFFYGDNKIQDAIEVISEILKKIDSFNESLNPFPFNLEIRASLGIDTLTFEPKNDFTKENYILKLMKQSRPGDLLITDIIFNQLSKNQKNFFYFEKLYEYFAIFNLKKRLFIEPHFQEAINVIQSLRIISEKLKAELKDFSKDNLDKIINIYEVIDKIKRLKKIIIECMDINFLSRNIDEGIKFLEMLKETENIIIDLKKYIEEEFLDLKEKLEIIIFDGILNQLEWFDEIELNEEIDKLEFILNKKKSGDNRELKVLYEEKVNNNFDKLIIKISDLNDPNQFYNLRRIIYGYFNELIRHIITKKNVESDLDTQNDESIELSDILWRHLYLFAFNDIYWKDKSEIPTYRRIPYINEKFQNFFIIIKENSTCKIMDLIAKFSDPDKTIIAKALSFHNNKEIVKWSLKSLKWEDIWHLIAFPETPVSILWLMYKELISRKEFKETDKTLFFICVFERIKNKLISSFNIEVIELSAKFLEEFQKSDFFVLDEYYYRIEELGMIFKSKLNMLGISQNTFKEILKNKRKEIEGIDREIKTISDIHLLENMPPWIKLKLAKQGFFTIFFVCQKNYYIAKAALKRTPISEIPKILKKKTLNQKIFFELAETGKFFTNSYTVKLLLKQKLCNEKLYSKYKKYLDRKDLREIRPYVNLTIRKKIDKDLNIK